MLCLDAQSCPTLWDPMDGSLPGSSVHGVSPGKNTGVGCHVLLQEIFTMQGSNPGLPHCWRILYHLSHQGRPELKKGKWKRSTAAHPFAISEHKGQKEDCKHFQREKICHQQRVMQSLLSDTRDQSTLECSRAFKCLRENSFYLEFCTK